MQSYLWATLFYSSTFFTVVSCAEFHAGHAAVHTSALSRRTRPTMAQERAYTEADEAMANLSTSIVEYQCEYIGHIGVGTKSDGTPQFQAKVVFDTGSTNLWVASTLCHKPPCDSDRALEFYDPQLSTTQEVFLDNGGAPRKKDIDVHFGTGELIGPLQIDTFHVGPFHLKQQPFAMIRVMNGGVFQAFPFEGILGLGFKDMSFAGIEPFFDRVIQQKVLPHNEFAFFMNIDSRKPSALLWGGIDQDLYHGPIRMFPVIQPHYWALELIDFKLGNVSIAGAGMKGDPVKRLIVDSGTTIFTAPPALHRELMKLIPSTSCKKANDYPPMTFVLRGADNETYDLVVTQETYMLSSGSGCEPGFMSLVTAHKFGPAILFGEVFMKHFFTVFDRGDGNDKNAKVGFAPANFAATPKVEQAESASFIETKASRSGMRSITLDSRAQMRSSDVSRKIRQHYPFA